MIYKISPRPSLLKRGKEKAEMPHSITRRARKIKGTLSKKTWEVSLLASLQKTYRKSQQELPSII